jgi:glutaredoxin
MLNRILIALALCALALPCAQAQTLYKIVTPDGRVVYTDHPPTQGKVLKTLTPDPAPATALPATAAEQLAKLQSLRAVTAVPTSGVVLYSAAWCGYCTKAKAWLAGKGIAYREVDIDTPDGMASFAQAGGGKGVPLLVANGQRVQGFLPSAYDQLFARK